MEQATAAEVCAYMESVTRYNPPDDEGIMVGVFRHAMYLMLTGSGWVAAQLPVSIQLGAKPISEAATLYRETATAIRAAQLAGIDEAPPTIEPEKDSQSPLLRFR